MAEVVVTAGGGGAGVLAGWLATAEAVIAGAVVVATVVLADAGLVLLSVATVVLADAGLVLLSVAFLDAGVGVINAGGIVPAALAVWFAKTVLITLLALALSVGFGGGLAPMILSAVAAATSSFFTAVISDLAVALAAIVSSLTLAAVISLALKAAIEALGVAVTAAAKGVWVGLLLFGNNTTAAIMPAAISRATSTPTKSKPELRFCFLKLSSVSLMMSLTQ